MTAHACFTAAAILLGASLGGPRDLSPSADTTLLIATDRALAGVDQFRITLVTQDAAQGEKLIDLSKLRAQIAVRLDEARIKYSDGEAGTSPRLVVQIKGMPVPECKQYVCRVQTSVSRVVTLSGLRDLQMEAEVWRLRPVMKVAAASDAGKAITETVLTQVEMFIGVYQATRKLQDRSRPVEPNGPEVEGPAQSKPSPQNLQAVSQFPFVASRAGLVFHRPDCRWAQNISGDNLLGYKTREEALQSGKRSCKSCKP